MKKFLIILALAAIAIPSIAFAAVFKLDANVPSGEAVMGNLYLHGGNPTVGGDVQGDLYVAGGNIIFTGTVTEDLVAAGGNISITGEVKGDVRAFGGSIFIDSKVAGEVIVAGGEIKIGPNAKIQQDLVVSGGTVTIDPAAKVFGSKTIKSGEDFEGKTGKFGEKTDMFTKYAQIGFWILHVLLILSYLLIGAVYMGVFPSVVRKFGTMAFAKGQFWKSLGLGFLVIVVTPVAAIISFMTGIGILFGVVLLLAYAIVILLNIVTAGFLFGALMKKVFTKAKKVEPSWAWYLGGIAVLHLLTLIPYLGLIVGCTFFLFSLGTMCTLKWKMVRSLK